MLNTVNSIVNGKNVLILGFGREGKSTLKILEKVNTSKSITIADLNDVDSFGYKKIVGESYLDCLNDYDVVFKSPGIVLKEDFYSYKCLITSQMDVFLRTYSSQCIGITGSKGKSTTSSLCNHLFKTAGYKTLLAGNIGIPVFDIYKDIEKDSVIVLEISCHQLEYTRFNPHISVLLNIYEEHLDHYGTFDKYKHAKENIYRFQDEDDYLIVNKENKPQDFYIGNLKIIGESKLPFESLDNIDTKLKGEHNYFNCEAIYEISKIYGIDENTFIKAINTFETLEHRLEFVGNKNGIDFINDSISTICESTINAIKAVSNIETLLIGGLDRGINYKKLEDYLNEGHVKNVVLMYASGKRIMNEFNGNTNFNLVYKDDLKSAFDWAVLNTSINKAIVLSPASASYDHFKNFEERGNAFKEMVNKL